MEVDDDMIMVIIGDEEEDNVNEETFQQTKIKEEILEDDYTVEELIETAQKHGEHVAIEDAAVNIKKEEDFISYEYEYLDDATGELDSNVEYTMDQYPEDSYQEEKPRKVKTAKKQYPKKGKREWKVDTQFDDDDDVDDPDFMPEDYLDEDIPDIDTSKPTVRRHRYSMAKWEVKSFVDELRQQYPELKKNNKMLLETLVEIMREVKAPPTPKDVYVLNGDMLECIICHSINETIPAAQRHYQEKHGLRYLVCYACGVDFRSKTNLLKHEKRCTAKDATVVLKARAISLGRKARGRPFLHLATKSYKRIHDYHRVKAKKRRFECTVCPAVFASKPNLRSHMYMHSGERPYRCYICNAAYTSNTTLYRHVQKHSNRKYICDHCGREFNNKTTLIAHLNTHLPQKKFVCDECGKRYAHKFALNIHIDAVHRKLPPPHVCQICPKRYRKMSDLKSHMLKAHGMVLMTRKMFFKKLPTMTETMLQEAKVVFKTEVDESVNLANQKLEIEVPQHYLGDMDVAANENEAKQKWTNKKEADEKWTNENEAAIEAVEIRPDEIFEYEGNDDNNITLTVETLDEEEESIEAIAQHIKEGRVVVMTN